MLQKVEVTERFREINPGYNSVFKPGRLSIGLVVPMENYSGNSIPSMAHHIERIQLAEELGFSAIWLRDVPFNVPSFGDAGHLFDPFVYLGLLAAQTRRIALGVASIVLPLRHPAHVAKAAATADVLSNGRLILGIASGDRPEEYPALNIPFGKRGELFRESYDYIRKMSEQTPRFDNPFGCVTDGVDMLPKPLSGELPLLITGSSQQADEWIAQNGDGWMTYPRPAGQQSRLIKSFRGQIEERGGMDKPVMEPFYLDLAADPDTPPRAIHLGFHMGIHHLRDYLQSRQEIGINHIALNLRFNQADPEPTLRKLADDILPSFSN
ncbi:MAG: LLM class oxidoreductase [Magnetococcales bacterium]|nr:LLM class oxidoreductase [Magnetococcales bacterium]